MQQFEEQLVRFIDNDLLDGTDAVTPDTYLFADGLINSLRILDLVAFVETSLDTVIRDRDVTMEHFRTPRAIARYFAASHES